MSVTTPNSATPVPPGTQVGRWVIQDQIGAGGTANVYRARPAAAVVDGERPEVAIRICRPVDRRHLDAIIATYQASPSHPNVLAVDSVFPVNLGGVDHVACVTEVGVRGTLEDRISHAPLDQIEARSLADDLLNGLDAYHRAGMVHGDVKPSNIMRFERGWKLADPAATETDETNLGTSTVVSHERTLRYVAPEALDARGKTKRSSDVWAFGVTLNEAVAGSPPFSSMVDQVSYNYQPSPTLGPELQHLVDASLAPPERRCATAGDLLAERANPKERERPLLGEQLRALDPCLLPSRSRFCWRRVRPSSQPAAATRSNRPPANSPRPSRPLG